MTKAAAARRAASRPALSAAFEQLIMRLDKAAAGLSPPPAANELYDAGCTLALRALFFWVAERGGMWPRCLPAAREVSVLRLWQQLSEASARGEVLSSAVLYQRIHALGLAVYGDGAVASQLSMRGDNGALTDDAAMVGTAAAGAFGGRLFAPTQRLLAAFGEDGLAWLDDATLVQLLQAMATVIGSTEGEAQDEAAAEPAPGAPIHSLGMLYEALLELRVERASEDCARLLCRANERALVPLSWLCEQQQAGPEALAEALHTRTGRSLKRITKLLEQAPREPPQGTFAPHLPGALAEQALPFVALMDRNAEGAAVVLPAGAAYVSGSVQRRARGSHFTPAALTGAVVERALTPWTAREQLPAAEEAAADALLSLRVCDVAMGAGAFLIAACDHIAEALLSLSTAEPTHAARVAMRALVARHCLCGVDKDPRAVDVAELSLWLGVGDPTLPFDLTHGRLCVGDSLIGVGPTWQLSTLSLRDERAFGGDTGPDDEPDTPTRRALRGALGEVAAGARSAREGGPEVLIERAAVMRDVLRAICDQLIDRCMVALPSQPALRIATADLIEALSAAWPRGHAEPQLMLALGRPQQAQLYDMFHWPLTFADIFAEGGFHAVLSNPPWVAYAGRAAQPLAEQLRHYYEYANPAFYGYRTLQGLFVQRAASLLRPGGRLGMVLPTSIADLSGYGPARRAHDQLCEPDDQLLDFGDGAFTGVFQPSMALTATRREQPHYAAEATTWRLSRNDLSPEEAALLAQLTQLPKLPPTMFGERGYQTQRVDKPHFVSEPGAGRLPIREGADIEELWLKPPRLHVDPSLLYGRFRPAEQWQQVTVLVRQTARYPIATVSDGVAFRNSLLAAFATERWPPHALAAYLNATPIRWFHYQTFRDARQGMPQVKIGHLRAIPDLADDTIIAELDQLGRRLIKELRILTKEERRALDALVARGLSLDANALQLICDWYAGVTASGSGRNLIG